MTEKLLWILFDLGMMLLGGVFGYFLGSLRRRKIEEKKKNAMEYVDLYDSAEWGGELTMTNEAGESFEILDICGIDCLWIDDDRIVIPESGFPCTIVMPDGKRIECNDGYLYWLRGLDMDPEAIGSIESKKCVVNGLGRVIAKEPFIDVDADGYLDLALDDIDYVGIKTGIESFLKWW